MLKRLKICLCTIATHSLMFVACHSLQAQSEAPPLNFAQEPSTGQEPRQSNWRMTILPRVVEPEAPKAKVLLHARGAFFDSLIPVPLVPGQVRPSGDTAALPELPTKMSDAVVVGQFTRPLAHLTPSEKSVYTEIPVRPIELLKTDDPEVTTSLTAPILLNGGAVRGPLGNKIRSPVNLGEYSVNPGHVYVFFLRKIRTGDFYAIIKTWDVTGGKAVPMANEDIPSSFRAPVNVGITLPDLIVKLKQQIKTEQVTK